MERVIDCPVCYNTDNCFEEMQEKFSSYLCFSCGFMSDSRYETGNIQLIENLKKSPQLVQDSKFEDTHRNIVWFPSVINMGKLGMIYPEGTKNEYVWKYAKVIEIPEEEREKYDNHTERLEVDGAETFEQHNFMGACKAMGITKDMSNG
jgi:hypothetical protein